MAPQQPDVDPVSVARDGPVAIVTMAYPERRNAFSLRMRTGLLATFDELMHRDAACRAIVLTGAGGVFCAGGDISEMKERPITDAREVFDVPSQLVRTIVNGPKPVVAAVEGVAYGAGLSLACASDHVVAAMNARFCAVFVRIGLLPDTGLLWTLARRVGAGKARELMMLASEVDGTEAHRLGIADRSAAPGEALATAIDVARTLAGLPAEAVALFKAAMATGDTPDDVARAEVDYQSVLHYVAGQRGGTS
jgi:enoyl-CoA hydratase/carnithine racemase